MAGEFDIEAEMSRLNLSADQVATMCGVNRTTIWRWRKKKPSPPRYVETIFQLTGSVRYLISKLAEK